MSSILDLIHTLLLGNHVQLIIDILKNFRNTLKGVGSINTVNQITDHGNGYNQREYYIIDSCDLQAEPVNKNINPCEKSNEENKLLNGLNESEIWAPGDYSSGFWAPGRPRSQSMDL